MHLLRVPMQQDKEGKNDGKKGETRRILVECGGKRKESESGFGLHSCYMESEGSVLCLRWSVQW